MTTKPIPKAAMLNPNAIPATSPLSDIIVNML